MSRLLILSEGKNAAHYEPLDLTRPCYMLRDGAYTNAGRWIELLRPSDVAFECRDYLSRVVIESTGWSPATRATPAKVDEVWKVEGLVQPLPDKRWASLKFDDFVWSDGLACVTRSAGKRQANTRSAEGLPLRAVGGLWNIIEHLPDQIGFDFLLWKRAHKTAPHRIHAPSKGVFVVGDPAQVWIGKKVRVHPQNVINTEFGPVILDDGVTIEPFNRIDGPAYLGRGTTLLGGKYTNGTAIGPGCKIGGEWEASVAQGFANKPHAGFFGHGILGEWVNLGAMTTNSDLKNTYGSIRVRRAGAEVDSGLIKVGSFMADHTKTGIGTLIPTGATWGVGVNYFGGDLAPKYLPSFVWGGNASLVEHHLDKMLHTAEAAITRRQAVLRYLGFADRLTDAQADMLRHLFGATATERVTFLREKHN